MGSKAAEMVMLQTEFSVGIRVTGGHDSELISVTLHGDRIVIHSRTYTLVSL